MSSLITDPITLSLETNHRLRWSIFKTLDFRDKEGKPLKINGEGGGMQSVHTPQDIADKVVSRMDIATLAEDDFINVYFNIELLQALQDAGVDMSIVTYFADTDREKRLASKLYGCDTYLVNEEMWNTFIKEPKELESFMLVVNKNKKRKFKATPKYTFSNPPYNNGIDLQIILALMKAGMLGVLICVHPTTWLVHLSSYTNVKSFYYKFRSMVGKYLRSVDFFNGNIVFSITLGGPCAITHWDFSADRIGSLEVSDLGSSDFRQVFDLMDCNLHGKDWDPTVKDFMGRVKGYCDLGYNLWNPSNLVSKKWGTSDDLPDQTKFYVQLAAIRGHAESKHATKMVKDDFYTFLQKDSDSNKGVRQPKLDRPGNPTPTYMFNTSVEQDNFIEYLKTDFSRMCVALYKVGANLATGELSIVPWLDFTRPWTDDELFTHFRYPKGHPVREYAKRFIPDYHEIYTIDVEVDGTKTKVTDKNY